MNLNKVLGVPVPIFVTSWNRPHFLSRVIDNIWEIKDGFTVHVIDSGSRKETVTYLLDQHWNKKRVQSLHLLGNNYGTTISKILAHTMAKEMDAPYYMCTDDDVMAGKMQDNNLITCMREIMDNHPELGCLALQLYPQVFQQPYAISDDGLLVYCNATGNTFKLVRTESVPPGWATGPYGDDSSLCKAMMEIGGYRTAYMRGWWCLHLGQCENWGYDPADLSADPRKTGYGPPLPPYDHDPVTFMPADSRYSLDYSKFPVLEPGRKYHEVIVLPKFDDQPINVETI